MFHSEKKRSAGQAGVREKMSAAVSRVSLSRQDTQWEPVAEGQLANS